MQTGRTRKYLVGLFAVGIVIAVAAALGLGALGSKSRDSVAFAAPAKVTDNGIRTASDAAKFNSDEEFMKQVGLSRADLAQTHSIYTFGTVAADYASGASIFLTPIAKGGFCLTFATASGCSATQPDQSVPVRGIGVDPDMQAGGEPFVMIGLAAGAVKDVSYRCGGTTYAAIVSGRVVAFVAPSATLTPHDCQQIATLAGGKTVTTQL